MKMILQQKQELNLRMTTELRQAIELLQLNTHDLELYIREQELENPLIELEERESRDSFQESVKTSVGGQGQDSQEWIKEQTESKRDQLIKQVNINFSDSETKRLLKTLIHNLDDNGYLSEETVLMDACELERGIALLQQLGPPGIGARNLRECLLLQVKQSQSYPDMAEEFIGNYLSLVAERKWSEIAKGMDISLHQVKELYEYVLTLKPRPCPELVDSEIEFVTPDIIVTEKEGNLSFHLNDYGLPKISLRQEYVSPLQRSTELSSYLHEYHKKAQWLLSSIEQRRQTIIRMVTELLEKQRLFFLNGREALVPMTLKDIADSIEMHESTISRVVSNKIIQTPVGTFEMRTLFTSKLDTETGASISQATVKSLLKTLIDEEDKRKPLSDQKIADYFREVKGVTISRRTISKYREELQIPTSNKRKAIV
ncbi:RNA polymerase factor sigma-54 [Sporosarcina sp. GW1-11]|uniref:RNA polymerase factor sigma-54 n=1 Tax=Sporosarcina sp. GW1-11 TaxID=2899126 RepID=UPI00294D7F31|nr:RNA polymerase factor sigma-54 [Sporosarcina sp. GW1-11]MDV6378333.1 RNA polymerase factor sigma-54 [Sporosarcina sp. GW1-11]